MKLTAHTPKTCSLSSPAPGSVSSGMAGFLGNSSFTACSLKLGHQGSLRRSLLNFTLVRQLGHVSISDADMKGYAPGLSRGGMCPQ